MTALPADTTLADLDERLGAWFQALLDLPVPERLLQHLEQLNRPEVEPAERG
jgi:hypothetical protein